MPEFEDKVRQAFDAEFERNRPRPGLRERVIANAVATPRVQRRGFGAWLTPPRLAVAGAAAAVLVVAGVGLRVATQGPTVAVKPTATASPSALAFGKLPAPGLHVAQGFGGGGTAPTLVPYFGPATMTWSGQLPKVPSTALVYKFTLPTTADADAFAARLSARLVSPGSGKEPRAYQLPGFRLDVQLDDPVTGEPSFILNSTGAFGANNPYTEDAARQAADAELARLGLAPSWKASVQVTRLQGFPGGPVIFSVQYQRVIPLPGGAEAPDVDGMGDPAGIKVDVDSQGHVVRIAGILRLAEQPATYPLQPPSAVVNAAVAATPAVSGDPGPPPTVELTNVTLVYTTVSSGGVGYLVPAYLFTGMFDLNGTHFEKRVLVPALAARAIVVPSP